MSATHGRAVVALDDLLTDPAGRDALAAAGRALADDPLSDQIAAAGRHVYDGMLEADRSGLFGSLYGADQDGIPGWLRLSLVDALVGFLDGTARTCLHDPSPRRPRPIVAAVWRPGVVTCGAESCRALLVFPPGSIPDRTCDGCGHVCAATGTDMIHAGVVAAGPLMLLYGVCRECDWEPA